MWSPNVFSNDMECSHSTPINRSCDCFIKDSNVSSIAETCAALLKRIEAVEDRLDEKN